MLPPAWSRTLENGEPVTLVGAHDALSALLAESGGCDGIWWSSLGLSAAAGVPDRSVLQPVEIATTLARGTRDSRLPQIVDADAGYGDEHKLCEAWATYDAAGAVGLAVEDYPHPKVSSLIREPGRRLCAVATMQKRLTSLRNAFGDQPCVMARTEALVVNGDVAEALRRGECYAESGADVLIVHQTTADPSPLEQFAQEWRREIPLAAIPTRFGHLSAQTLHALGYEIVIFANALIRAAAKAMIDALVELRAEDRLATLENDMMPVDDLLAILEQRGTRLLPQTEGRGW